VVSLGLAFRLLTAPEPVKKLAKVADELEKIANEILTSDVYRDFEHLVKKIEELEQAARDLYNYVEPEAIPPALKDILNSIVSQAQELKRDVYDILDKMKKAREMLSHLREEFRRLKEIAVRIKKVTKLAKKIEKELSKLQFETSEKVRV
jgi:septation ring formation regulator EzrA